MEIPGQVSPCGTTARAKRVHRENPGRARWPNGRIPKIKSGREENPKSCEGTGRLGDDGGGYVHLVGFDREILSR